MSAVLTLGSFDGLHIGHRRVIERVMERAQELRSRSMLVTFEPHPLAVVDPARAPKLILNRQEKFRRLESLGLDAVYEIQFNRAVSMLSPRQFVQELILSALDVREVIIGYDHHFGHGRAGSARSLAEFGEEQGFRVEVIPPVRDGGAIVSCTRIRAAIREGRIEEAAELLERPFALSGVVDRGDGRGKGLGFPTANISLTAAERLKVQPRPGVYAVCVETASGEPHIGMLNYGERPTFGLGEPPRFEVHLLDFSGNLYGEHLTVAFHARIRDERRFENAEALREQLEQDQVACRTVLCSG
jgi:riboflavin kinase/FMN adenylyltransferase